MNIKKQKAFQAIIKTENYFKMSGTNCTNFQKVLTKDSTLIS